MPGVTRSGLPASGESVEIKAGAFPFDDGLAETPGSPGECRDAGVLFAELSHADSLADGRSADEVGSIVRGFFKVVGEVTDAHDGYTERSDLCAVVGVFGEPASSTRAADAALAGARELRERLTEELPGAAFGIGVSVGASVAGWIRAARRFEPLTICAPVTEATRLCELAERRGQSVLASERALSRASSIEAGRWASAAAVIGVPAATPAST